MGRRAELVGRRFGRLTVVSESDRLPGKPERRWFCVCDCGGSVITTTSCLSRGRTKSCGCFRREISSSIGKNRAGKTSKGFGRPTYFPIVEGMKFNQLTVIRRNTNRKYHWDCLCDCGAITTVFGTKLRTGGTKSCGCRRYAKDLSGIRYGHLVVIGRSDTEKYNSSSSATWRCMCDCGRIALATTNELNSGHTTSCGCFNYSYNLRRSYEENIGKIPEGFVVTALDGDISNCNPENLYLMSSKDNYRLRDKHIKGCPELKMTAIKLIELERMISNAGRSD